MAYCAYGECRIMLHPYCFIWLREGRARFEERSSSYDSTYASNCVRTCARLCSTCCSCWSRVAHSLCRAYRESRFWTRTGTCTVMKWHMAELWHYDADANANAAASLSANGLSSTAHLLLAHLPVCCLLPLLRDRAASVRIRVAIANGGKGDGEGEVRGT